MQAKAPVKPRAPGEAPTRPPAAGLGSVSLPPAPTPAAAPPAEDDLESLDFTGIQLAEETDPLQAVIEQAAIAYANGRDNETRTVLMEAARGADRSPEAERVWLMLFDLCQLTGNRAAFDELELDYARRFEKQPPTWTEAATAAGVAAAAGVPTAFKGELCDDNPAGFDHAAQLLEKSPKLRLDLGKVRQIDAAGCQRLLDLLARARKLRREVELLGLETLLRLLEPIVAAEDDAQAYWCLLLQVLQRQGRQEDFDNVALAFAVKFEISPPAYEPPPPAAAAVKAAPPGARADNAFYLAGQIAGGRLDGLDAWLKGREQAIIDCSGVVRMDFVSAGTLLNLITPHRQRGLAVILRHPNRLVAELLRVVGVESMASIVFARK